MDPVPLPNPDEPRFTIHDVCKRFGVSRTRYYELVSNGLFPRPQIVAGKPCYSLADLAAYQQLAGRWEPGAFKDSTPKKKKRNGDEETES